LNCLFLSSARNRCLAALSHKLLTNSIPSHVLRSFSITKQITTTFKIAKPITTKRYYNKSAKIDALNQLPLEQLEYGLQSDLQSGEYVDALGKVNRIRNRGGIVTLETYHKIIRGFCEKGEFGWALETTYAIVKNRHPELITSSSYDLIMDYASKAGDDDVCLAAFTEIRFRLLQLTLNSYIYMLRAIIKRDNLEDAVRVYGMMKAQNPDLVPDKTMFKMMEEVAIELEDKDFAKTLERDILSQKQTIQVPEFKVFLDSLIPKK